jgi:hypothetical protein
MKYREWDYRQIMSDIAMVREEPFRDEHIIETVIDEFKRLNYYGWPVICQVAERVFSCGKFALRDKLWLIVRDFVNEKINEIKAGKGAPSTVPVYIQSGFNLISLNTSIKDEIQLWVNSTPPLKYKGIDIINRIKYYNPEVFDIGMWDKKDRPELQNKLMDDYCAIFIDSIEEEESKKQDGILLQNLTSFYNLLQTVRSAQMQARIKEQIQQVKDKNESTNNN